MNAFSTGGKNLELLKETSYILPEACTESNVGCGVIFKLINVTVMRILRLFVNIDVMFVCFCMHRQDEIWVDLGTGSGQIKNFYLQDCTHRCLSDPLMYKGQKGRMKGSLL